MSESSWTDMRDIWSLISTDERAALVAIAGCVQQIGPRALRILQIQAERLREGAAIYNSGRGGGDFDEERSYTREALEELLDSANYLSAALLGLNDEERRERRPTLPSPPPEAP